MRTPNDQLNRIAAAVGLQAGEDRRALEQELVSSLTDRAWLQGLLADLGDDEWAALKVVYFNGGDQGMTVELCHQIVNLLAGRRRKTSARSVEELLNRGLIYSRAQNYRQVFFIPTDLLGTLGEILSRQMVYRICLGAETPARTIPMGRDLMEDAHRFLAYIFKTDVTLTQQGQVFKRHLRALLELLAEEAEDEEESPTGRYPEPLGLLMGYALDRRLLARSEGTLRPGDELRQWVGKPIGAKQADLYGYWQDRYFYQDLQTFLAVMGQVGTRWVSLDRLAAELEPLINPSQRGSFLLRLRHHLNVFLGPMGLFEVGEADGDEQVCRVTPAGREVLAGNLPHPAAGFFHGHFLLQATFEILATRPVDAAVLWNLERLGDLIGKTDRTLTYRLSRPSVYRGLKFGMSGEEMLEFLRRHSSTGVPQNVAFDLKAWTESYGQVYLQAVMLLRCATPILAQQVKASRRTARFVLGELSATDLIVNEAEYADLLEALEADGLMPRPTVERPSAKAP